MTRESQFTRLLLNWNRNENNRLMPWKNEKNPYRIWISEIILQQTQVNQGLAFYDRFIIKFPGVSDLANADESDVFKMWEGLGYYNRCKNLITSARFIVNELDGNFPNSYEAIRELKGIGPYTAAAIASFAFNLPYAVCDGNVFRVLSRVFGISLPIDSGPGKKTFADLAQKLLDKQVPGIYNQSIMDFGATICKPQIPLCTTCVLNKICFAFKNSLQEQLPVKQKKTVRKTRWLYYFLIEYKNKIYVRKRVSKDIWQNLFEFVMIEKSKEVNIHKRVKDLASEIMPGIEYSIKSISDLRTQLLTHQVIKGRFIEVVVEKALEIGGYQLVKKTQLKTLPFPKFITTYLED